MNENINEQRKDDPDAVLMQKFQQGDKAAFEALMVKYYPRLLNFIYRFVRNEQEAEDLTQETFIKVYHASWKYSSKAQFKTWLYTIAKNLALNAIRKNSRTVFSLDAEFTDKEGENRQREIADDNAATADDKAIKDEEALIIKRALSSLPENQRIAIVLLRYESFSYEEIAETMSISVKAVKSILNRAKENLRIRLSSFINEEK
jgi:RNA polymerase sigma-70 factor (ECF subfamily)